MAKLIPILIAIECLVNEREEFAREESVRDDAGGAGSRRARARGGRRGRSGIRVGGGAKFGSVGVHETGWIASRTGQDAGRSTRAERELEPVCTDRTALAG